MAKQAAEIIGFHLGWDIGDVKEGRYQRTHNPALYVCGNDYYCCPTEKQKLPNEYNWQLVGRYYDRNVYRSK